MGAGTELAGSPLTLLEEAVSGKYCVTVKLLFSLHVLPGTLKVYQEKNKALNRTNQMA